MPTLFESLYRDVLTLPDEETRRVRLEGLEQAMVNLLFDKGYLLARPTIQVKFNDLAPQGHPRPGAHPQNPGQVIMRSDRWGRVATTTGCAPPPIEDEKLRPMLIHRWAALFHELGHFTFDQLSAKTLTGPLEGLVSKEGVAGIREHVWAPFLSNKERHRLNETFADVWAGAALLDWLGSAARPELETLRAYRQRAREASQQAWQSGDRASADAWVHVSDLALDRLLRDPQPPPKPASAFLDWVVNHAVRGTVARWQIQGPQAIENLGQSWCDPLQVQRLQTALLHARQNRDQTVIETWLADHPEHPWMRLARQLRWTAPSRVGLGALWHQSWQTKGQAALEEVHRALHATELHLAVLPPPVLRRRRHP